MNMDQFGGFERSPKIREIDIDEVRSGMVSVAHGKRIKAIHENAVSIGLEFGPNDVVYIDRGESIEVRD